MKNICIIGSGFSSLATASYLAQAGHSVSVHEKNDGLGGRARQHKQDGFTFDMGPSWYWMPDVFERFFNDFDKKPSDYYKLTRLSPSYRVFFEDTSYIDISDNLDDIKQVFEQIEPGSSKQLDKFLKEAEYNYNVAIKDLVYRPGLSPLELITPKTISKINQFFTSIRGRAEKSFKSDKLRKLVEFPVLFLGAKPQDTPLFYNFMNYADLVLGTWYPDGGMYSVVDGMVRLAQSMGVDFHTGSNVSEIVVKNGKTVGVKIGDQFKPYDIVVSGADYHHSEQLLEPRYRSYSEKYWNRKTFAPSALLYYIGIDKKLKNLTHHTLFFDESFDIHANAIYDEPKWPESPLFYASFPSMSDPAVAPEGKECATLLIPLAPDLKDDEHIREMYLDKMIERLERLTDQNISDHIIFKRSYCVQDFKNDYNSYKGNAYGMANTLTQTAFLRPKIKSKNVKNLYFTGQLTVPGPGVPPAIISGKLVADLVLKKHPIIKQQNYESSI